MYIFINIFLHLLIFKVGVLVEIFIYHYQPLYSLIQPDYYNINGYYIEITTGLEDITHFK